MINKVLLNRTVMSPSAVLGLKSHCTLPSIAAQVRCLDDTSHR